MQSIYAYKNKFVRINIYDFMRINELISIRLPYGQHLLMLRRISINGSEIHLIISLINTEFLLFAS